jgi:hypothetical protein
MKKEKLSYQRQSDVDEGKVIPNSEEDDLDQTDPMEDGLNSPSTKNIQKRKRNSKDLLPRGGITGCIGGSKNERGFTSKKIKGSKPHLIQQANQASQDPVSLLPKRVR